MKVLDITRKLDESIPVYQGDPRFSLEVWRSIDKDSFMLSKIRMGTHSGTHIDAPCHFIEGGKSVYELPIQTLVGPCVVTDDPTKCSYATRRVLVRGAKGRLDAETARLLIKNGVSVIGTEHQSIGDDDVHKILLGNDCIIIECLCLDKVAPGEYTLCAPPLKIEADGSPVRACLIKEEARH